MATDILLEGLCFGEGPRWHDGALWLSDMHAHQVLRVTSEGSMSLVVEVPGQPSGLGWLPTDPPRSGAVAPEGSAPGGDLLIVSMVDRRVLRWNGTRLTEHANLAQLASFHCNDMVVDRAGRAYVGNFGFDLHGRSEPRAAEMICIEPDGRARVVARELMFPNGTVITPDGRTLIVGESWGARLTAFDVLENGDLANRRIWAALPKGAVPDGICLDEAGGIWSASPSSNECLRQIEGGEVTHRVAVGQGAFACMLGGADGRTLFILTAADSDPETCRRARSGRIETFAAPYAHAGLP